MVVVCGAMGVDGPAPPLPSSLRFPPSLSFPRCFRSDSTLHVAQDTYPAPPAVLSVGAPAVLRYPAERARGRPPPPQKSGTPQIPRAVLTGGYALSIRPRADEKNPVGLPVVSLQPPEQPFRSRRYVRAAPTISRTV